MNERLKLKFKKHRLFTTFSWLGLLFLGGISRGVISDWLFWLVVISVSLLFISDFIYFVFRITEAHYLLITSQTVVIKKIFNKPEIINIEDIQSVVVYKDKLDDVIKRIIISDGATEIDIKLVYTLSKENIFRMIKNSSRLPKDLEFTYE